MYIFFLKNLYFRYIFAIKHDYKNDLYDVE